jgi:hypothetical protein
MKTWIVSSGLFGSKVSDNVPVALSPGEGEASARASIAEADERPVQMRANATKSAQAVFI